MKPTPHPNRRRALRILTIAALVLIAAAAVILYTGQVSKNDSKPSDFTKVTQQIDDPAAKIKDLEVTRGASVTINYQDSAGKKPLSADYPDERSLRDVVARAQRRHLPVLVRAESNSIVKDLLIQLIPMLLFFGLIVLLMTRMSGVGKLIGGGKRFQAIPAGEIKVTFDDVEGIGEAREKVREVVEFLRDSERFTKVGARVPRGVLFVGPPGTGKTLMAKAVAGESNASFFSLTGSDFVEMLAGLGANRMRKLFDNARAAAPSIIFIDEIDAVGRHRSGGGLGGNDEREQTLNQMLSEMDGFKPGEAVVVIAATNRPDVLDAALLRPGRFDRQITIDPPDAEGRRRILTVHAKGKQIAPELLDRAARQTPGFTGAQLANLLNEAAILAALKGSETIDADCINRALMQVIAGLESPRVMTEEERSRIAYHEVGHALCAHFTEHRTPVQRISIVSRGRALGFTWSVPEQDRLLETRASLMDQLTMLLGGRAAELMIFGSASSGASNDLERATALATQMVTRMGLSDAIGPRVIPTADDSYVPGSAHLGQLRCSPQTAQLIEDEVRRIIEDAQERAGHLLDQHRQQLETVTCQLAEKENLDAGDFLELLGEQPTADSAS